MSADNYAQCPQCVKRYTRDKDAALAKADQVYALAGDCPSWTEACDRAAALTEPKETLRENWEILTDVHGKFTVDYSCCCNACGFAFEYKHTEQVPL